MKMSSLVERRQAGNRERHSVLWRHNRNLINLERHGVYSSAECIESRGLSALSKKKRKRRWRRG